MKVILTTMGTMGDVNPFIGMGIALKKQGHDVTILTCEKFETVIRKEGMNFFSVNSTENMDKAMSRFGIEGEFKLSDLKNLDRLIYESLDLVWFQPVKPTYEFICREYTPGQTVLIANSYNWGAKFAQEKLGLPLITTFISPVAIRSADKPPQISPFQIPEWFPRWLRGYLSNSMLWFFQDRFIQPAVDKIRQELGLEKISLKGDRWMFSPEKVIGLIPEWFAQPQADWLPQIELVGFPFYDQSGDKELSSEIMDFLAEGEPPVVFTPGSFVKSEAYFQQAAKACQELGKRAIFLSPVTHELPKEISPSIKFFGYVPHSKLLPHAAAMVYHGGIGTTAKICRAGIPHLIVPNVVDHFDTGSRIKKLGLGDILGENKFFSPMLAHKLKMLTESEEIKTRCREIARTIDTAEDAFSRVCSIVEKLATSHPADGKSA